MRSVLVAFFLAVPVMSSFGGTGDSTLWSTAAGDLMDSGWVVTFPTGSSDYFDVTYDVVAGIGDVESPAAWPARDPNAGRGRVAGGLDIKAIAVSVADFGSGRHFPQLGIFPSNLVLDPTGETPELSSPIAKLSDPPLPPSPLFEFVLYEFPASAPIPSGSSKIHAVGQLPVADSGLLGIGADSGSASGGSGFTQDGYATASVIATFL